MSWCRSRSTRPIPIGCRTTRRSRPATSSRVPLGAREALGVVWADDVDDPARPAQPHQGRRAQARLSAAQAGAAQVRRLGVGLHAQRRAAWCCACACAWARSRAGAREGRRAARRPAAEAHDRGARARAAAARRRHGAHQERGRARGRRVGRRDRRADRRRHAGDAGAAAGAGGAPARSRSRTCRNSPTRSAPAADALRATVDEGRLFGDAGRRRHRLGQDRGLFRGGGAKRSGAASRC